MINWNQVPNNSITAIEITPDGNTAIAGTLNGDLLFYGLPYLKYETEITITPPFRTLRMSVSRHQYKINGIESFIDGNSGESKMVVNSTDSKIRIYQIRDKSLSISFKGHLCQTSLFRPHISENGLILLSPSEDKSIFFWKNTEENLESTIPTNSSTRQSGLDRLIVDDQVLCAQFASSKIYFWKNSFSTSNNVENADELDFVEPLVLLTSDVSGRICVYKNEFSSAALTVRSIKDITISPVKTIKRNSNTGSIAKGNVMRSSSRESLRLPEINVSPGESFEEPRKQNLLDSLFSPHSLNNSRRQQSFLSQFSTIPDQEEEK